MALLTGSPNLQGSLPSLQGGAVSLQGSSPNLQPTGQPSGQPIVQAPASSVGVKAVTPTPTVKKTTLPASQVAQKDLSGTYANVGGTIYNKQAQAKFSNPADFFKDSGVTSFNNLKFDTGYTPTGSESIYGQLAPSQSTPQTQTAPTSPSTPILPPQTLFDPTTPYTPPNQGTTGVSQGGIIGNLINYAQHESPQVKEARDNLAKLQSNLADQTANIEGSPIDLSLATGQEGILNRLFAAKQSAAQTALQNALTSQQQGITATTSAGGLNAPITNPQTGALVSPSNPGTTSSTAAGTPNLNTLVGQRPSPSNPGVIEFYNTSTNQGFSNPQDLANFVNQKNPGLNATAQNVFDILKTQGGGSQNNPNLNPLNNLSNIASQVLSGQISPSQAYAMGGTIPNWQSVLNGELSKQSGGKFDQSAAQAKYDANQTTQGGQAQQVAAYQSARQQASNLATQFGDLVTKYNLNPSEFNVVNGVLQTIASNTSDARYQALSNYINDITATYAQILGSGGQATDFKTQLAHSFISSLQSGASLPQTLASIDQQAQAKIAGIKTPSTTGGGSSTGTNVGSLVGQRPSASNPGVTEYYNKQTGQGFSSPQDLANFINQQNPSANATSQNVFSLLGGGASNTKTLGLF